MLPLYNLHDLYKSQFHGDASRTVDHFYDFDVVSNEYPLS